MISTCLFRLSWGITDTFALFFFILLYKQERSTVYGTALVDSTADVAQELMSKQKAKCKYVQHTQQEVQ